MVEIKYLGITKIILNGKDITSKFGGKTLALLGLLLINNTGYISKEKLISYLWPESTEDAGKYNLRYNLWLIRKFLPRDNKKNEIINTIPNMNLTVMLLIFLNTLITKFIQQLTLKRSPLSLKENLWKGFSSKIAKSIMNLS